MRRINKRFSFCVFAVVLLSLILNSCTPQKPKADESANTDTLKGKISISGAFALYPLAVKWSEEFKKIHPNVTIDINAGGAGKGMADVLANMVDLAMFSREVADIEIEKGAWKIAVAKDAVFPTINTKNPQFNAVISRGLTKTDFNLLFTGKVKTWGEVLKNNSKESVNVYTRSDACGAAATWAEFFSLKQEDLKGTGVFGDPGLADAVKKDILGIGFNNLVYLYDQSTGKPVEGLSPIPIDINENGTIEAEENFYADSKTLVAAIQQGKYPSPPSRNLYFISKGKPSNKLVSEFLNYILKDGQQFVDQSGYVRLSDDIIQKGITDLQ